MSRSSWLTLAGSIALHAAAFAVAARFVTGSGGMDAPLTMTADGDDALALSVKVSPRPQPSENAGTTGAARTDEIRRAQPAQQQRVFAMAPAAFSLPAPVAVADLPEALMPEKPDAAASAHEAPDAPPAPKKIAGRASRKGGGTSARGPTGSGEGAAVASAPKPLATRVPVYPYSAKKRGEQGMVLVRVRVNEAGRVESSTLYKSCGHSDLDEAAVACVWKWTFAPGLAGGRPAASSAVVRVSFRLE